MVSRPPVEPPIRGLEPMSLTAWAGRVSAVLWLQGCNLQCQTQPFCPWVLNKLFSGGSPVSIECVDGEGVVRKRTQQFCCSRNLPCLQEPSQYG